MREGAIVVGPDDPRLIGRRVEGWAVDVLDDNDALKFSLTGLLTGRITQNRNTTIRGGGYIEFVPQVGEDVNYLRDRFRVWQYVTVGADLLAWAWITGVPQKPSTARDGTSDVVRLNLLDKMLVLHEDGLPETYSLPAGTVVTAAVAQLITEAGETALAITDSPLTLRSPLSWESGTTRLRIINDLLDSIGYFSVWCDGMGRYRVEPYTLPATRRPVREFRAGQDSLHGRKMTRDQDVTSIPNRVIVRTRAGYEEPGMQSVWQNTDPTSPFSYQNRGGRWITDTREGVEAADQATLDAMAARIAAEATAPAASWSVTHASLPLSPNQVVLFAPRGVEPRLCVIQEYTASLSVGDDVQATWQEVSA